MSHVGKRQRGFTLVELTLAMAFIGLLLLAITMLTMQIGTFYNRGTVLAQVNQTGTRIMQDMQATIARSPLLTESEDGTIVRMQRNDDAIVVGGRLCTGAVSYIWNLSGHIDEAVNRFDKQDVPLRLVRVIDRSKKYCSDMGARVSTEEMTDLLPDGETLLALHAVNVHRVAYDAVRQAAIYAVELDIGTDDQELLLFGADGSTRCQTPKAGQQRQVACAVTRFEFTAQSGGQAEEAR